MNHLLNDGIPSLRYRGQNARKPSRSNGIGNAVLMPIKEYSGVSMLGVAQMHKSNSIPIFSESSIIDVAKMRR